MEKVNVKGYSKKYTLDQINTVINHRSTMRVFYQTLEDEYTKEYIQREIESCTAFMRLVYNNRTGKKLKNI